MRGLDINKNSPVSVTKLTLGLGVGFISSHLPANKLFPVNPREIAGKPKMSLLLEPKSMPALIIKPRLILVMHTDDLDCNITSNQQGQMFVQNLKKYCQQAKCYAIADPVFHHRLYSSWLDVWGKLYYQHTSVEPPEPSKWLPTERSDLSYLSVLQQQPVLCQGHQSSGGQVFHHVHGLGRQPTDRNRRQFQSQKLQLHDSWWW